MAFYIPYIAGSASFAYASNLLYTYVYPENEQLEISPKNTESKIDTEIINNVYDTDIPINVYDTDTHIITTTTNKKCEPTEKEYKCHICIKQLTITHFSKNQQKNLEVLSLEAQMGSTSK